MHHGLQSKKLLKAALRAAGKVKIMRNAARDVQDSFCLLEPTCAGIRCHADIALRWRVWRAGPARALSAGGAGPLDAS
eukprot:635673-Prymnesium_polylepis.1